MRADRRGRVPMVSAVGAPSNDGSCSRLGSSRVEGLSGSPLPCSGSTPATGVLEVFLAMPEVVDGFVGISYHSPLPRTICYPKSLHTFQASILMHLVISFG